MTTKDMALLPLVPTAVRRNCRPHPWKRVPPCPSALSTGDARKVRGRKWKGEYSPNRSPPIYQRAAQIRPGCNGQIWLSSSELSHPNVIRCLRWINQRNLSSRISCNSLTVICSHSCQKAKGVVSTTPPVECKSGSIAGLRFLGT